MAYQFKYLLTKDYELVNTIGAFVYSETKDYYELDGQKYYKQDIIYMYDTKEEMLEYLAQNNKEIKKGKDWL